MTTNCKLISVSRMQVVRLLVVLLQVGQLLSVDAGEYEVVEADNALSAYYQGKLLWIYNHDPTEGKPYFHPLAATSGSIFTDLRPQDHPWHYGVWFSWKYINGVNYWEEKRKTGKSDGQTRIVAITHSVTEQKTAKLVLKLEYAPAGSSEVIMREQRHVVVTAPDKSGSYMIKWSATFQAIDQDVVLDRTPLAGQVGGQDWGGYSGWSVRMNKAMQGGTFINNHGKEGADRQSANWTLFKAPVSGSLLLMDHPDNLNFPAKWYLHDRMPFFSPAVIHDEPHTIPAGERLHLRYQLLVAPTILEVDEAHRIWQSWLEGAR